MALSPDTPSLAALGPGTFSARTRQAALEAMAAGPVDVLIVGGGITGAGAARDAALRGLRTALVEKEDFAAGTSSKSTKLIHGGLRYLEQLELGLVRESLREQTVLLRIAPYLVWPLRFLFPVRGLGGLARLDVGMHLYAWLARRPALDRFQMLGRRGLRQSAPLLAANGLAGAAVYSDCQTNDARLTLATLLDARAAGAWLASRAEVVEFIRPAGRVAGALVRDRISGRTLTVDARVTVSAAGPWTDRISRLADPGAPARLQLTKGIHLIFDRSRLPIDQAVVIPSARDGRIMFVLPWGPHHTIAGTTDTAYTGDLDDVGADADDVGYVLAAVNAAFPSARLTPGDVRGTWAGLRPLIARPGARSSYRISREHEVWEISPGLLAVAGGKLTTYRVMARALIDRAVQALGPGPWQVPPPTDARPLAGAAGAVPDLAGWDREIAEHLVRAYGDRAAAVVAMAGRHPDLARRLVATQPVIAAEVVHAVLEEMALTPADFLARRTWLLYRAPDAGMECLDEVIRWMAPLLGWSPSDVEEHREAYAREVARTRRWARGLSISRQS